ncbi:calcium-activated chloride channel-domain-containing protein, partial [Chytriomyces sp. MP71]
WLKAWAKNWALGTKDLNHVREHMGEQIAYYFAFLHFYLQALIPIAIIGVAAYFFLDDYSTSYSLLLCMWSITFIVAWKRQQASLAESWGVVGTSKVDRDRPEFVPESYVVDPVSGETVGHYPIWKRLFVHAFATGPLIVLFVFLIAIVTMAILTVEVYTTAVYDGPYKQFVALTPVLLYVLSLPLISTLYFQLSKYLTDLENNETKDSYTTSLTRKSFILTCLLTQLSLLLVGLLYIPLSDLIMQETVLLPLFRKWSSMHLHLEAGRNLLTPAFLQERVLYFSVTAQVVNQLVEVLLPVVLAWVQAHILIQDPSKPTAAEPIQSTRETEVAALAKEIEDALAMPVYDMYDDYAELANQFGILVMFSASWPLVGLACLINNFTELRTDAFKICKTVRRPIPDRTESIAPWSQMFAILSLLGTATTALLTALYSNWDPAKLASEQTLPQLGFLVLLLIAVEHTHVALSFLVSVGMDVVWGDMRALKERREKYTRISGRVEEIIVEYEGGEAAVDAKVDEVVAVVDEVFGTKMVGLRDVHVAKPRKALRKTKEGKISVLGFNETAEQVLMALGVYGDIGLSTEEAENRLLVYGPNG